MGLKDNLMRFIVLGALVVGFIFGVWVLTDCNYLESEDGASLELGVYRYSLDNPGGEFDTGGSCEKYDDKAANSAVRAAQVFGVLAPIFGMLLLFLIGMQQFFFNIPCSGIIISISYIGAQVS